METATQNDFAYIVTKNSINISVKTTGESHIIRATDPRFAILKTCIREGRWDEVPDYLSTPKLIAKKSDGRMTIKCGRVYVNTRDGQEWAVPSDLNNTILEYMEQELPFQALINFAINLSDNPDQNAVYGMFEFIKKNNITITEEGNFIAYKGVSLDFKDLYSGTLDNSVGKTVSMPREKVESDQSRTCSAGLHVASYDYAFNGYGGRQMIFVEVNPKDVCAVPREYSMAKMRVCRYVVLGISEGNIKAKLYQKEKSTDVDAESDADAARRGAMPLREE